MTERIWRANAHVYIDAPTLDAAQNQMEDWVAEHMPTNFVIGWTMGEDRICANETCDRPSAQDGRSDPPILAKYCSDSCARAQAQRAYRRRNGQRA